MLHPTTHTPIQSDGIRLVFPLRLEVRRPTSSPVVGWSTWPITTPQHWHPVQTAASVAELGTGGIMRSIGCWHHTTFFPVCALPAISPHSDNQPHRPGHLSRRASPDAHPPPTSRSSTVCAKVSASARRAEPLPSRRVYAVPHPSGARARAGKDAPSYMNEAELSFVSDISHQVPPWYPGPVSDHGRGPRLGIEAMADAKL